jgi:undecaprenyl-diphosphatase
VTQIVEAPIPKVQRSPSDILRLIVAFVVLVVVGVVQWLFGDTLVQFGEDLLTGLNALPSWMLTAIVVGTRVLTAVVLIGGLIVVARKGGGRLLVTVAAAAIVANGLASVLEQFDPEPGAEVIDVHDGLGFLTDGFPTAYGIAAVTAALTAAAPWLSRRARRVGWVLVLALALVHFMAEEVSFDSLRAVLCGWLAGALMVVAFGGPSRRPTGQAIADGLAAVGTPLAELRQASLDARGSTPYFGKGTDGQGLFVKALGDDQRSADLMFRLYRMIGRRELGDERPFSSLRRAVEHEAMVALAARDVGIRTPRLAAFATAEPHGFVLAYEAVEGKSLDRVDEADVTDEVLGAVWEQVVLMRTRRIAHRDMRLANIFLAADGNVWMIDFGFSELAASDLLLANDVAEFIASSSLKVGPERAVRAASAAIGPVALATALDRLRPWALSGATRTGLKENPALLDDIRARITAVASPVVTG